MAGRPVAANEGGEAGLKELGGLGLLVTSTAHEYFVPGPLLRLLCAAAAPALG
jgi:hypothetical protein